MQQSTWQSSWPQAADSTEQWRTDGFWRICDYATIDYRMKSPRSRASRRWQVGLARPEGPYADIPWVPGSPVVICAFCKHVLCGRQQGSNRDFTRDTNSHTLSCGLWFLAFDEPVDPVRDLVIRQRELLRRLFQEENNRVRSVRAQPTRPSEPSATS